MILAAPARGQAPVVDPGETHFFNLPDVIEGDCDLFLGPVLATCVVDDIAPLGSPLSSFVVARQRLGRAKSVIHQSHDFKVDATWDSGTVLDALVTGSIDTRGFLLLLGVGQVNVKVVVELLDVTDPMNAFVVTSQTVSSHGLSQGMLPSVGLSLKIEGGAPYIGGGASISVGFGLRMAQEFIRDSDSFSLATKLRRGNTYRLVVKSTSEAKLGASGLGLGASPLGGRAVASFLDPAALADPNLIPANMMREFLDGWRIWPIRAWA